MQVIVVTILFFLHFRVVHTPKAEMGTTVTPSVLV